MKVIVKPRDIFAKMNKTEAAYAQILEAMKRHGDLREWWFNSLTFLLADDTRYTPDFALIHPDGEMSFTEVKGFWRDDAKVKIKVAARQYPFRFEAVRKAKGGGFETQDFTDCVSPSPSSPSGA